VLICSDGGYMEPAPMLALKGAKVIFAPLEDQHDYPAPGLWNAWAGIRNEAAHGK
jgi:hypothetical protein